MAPAGPTTVLLWAATAADEALLRRPLEEAGHLVCAEAFIGIQQCHLATVGVVLIAGGTVAEALTCCRRLTGRRDGGVPPVLVLLDSAAPADRLACLEAGADAYLLRPFAPGELTMHVQALLRLRQVRHRLADQAAEMHGVHQRLQQAYQQIDLELEAARRLQMSFLPQTLPEVPHIRLAVQYRPCGRVGGDFYDVFRLDENHIGLYVADAMGHGVPASLLTIFLKRGVCGKEIRGRQYRLVPPAEVLERLNRDLLEQALPEMPFITMLYALIDFRDGTVRYARAGHPQPLHVPGRGAVEAWPGDGGLLGVFVTSFPEQTRRLAPGDKLLLYTDGLETATGEHAGPALPRLLAGVEQHRALPIDKLVPQLTHELLGPAPQTDDFTLLGLEMTE